LKPAQANKLRDLISKISNIKGLAKWLKWQNACLASVRPQVQTPVLPKKKKLDMLD
jgi:hypothetical protein